MRKEVLFAVLAGGIFGLIIAFGIWRLNTSLSDTGGANTESSPTPTPSFGLTIAKPVDNQVVTTSPFTISGITKPGSWLVVLGEEEDFLAQAEDDGSFFVDVELVGGINQLKLIAYDTNGSFQEQDLLVVYSTEFADNLEGEGEEEATSSAETDDVRERVQEKVREAQNLGIAYLGTATDISTNTIQMRTLGGEIVLAAVSENATFASTVGSTEEIEFEDVALGDFVVAMGFENGNEVLDARRILVVEPPEDSTTTALFGTVESVERREISLNVAGTSWTLDFPSTWKGPETSEIEEGDLLIATGTEGEENTISIRGVFFASAVETETDTE